MGDGRQQPENGKGLGFEASARSERRFRDPFAPGDTLRAVSGVKDADSPIYSYLKNLVPPSVDSMNALNEAGDSGQAENTTPASIKPAAENPTLAVLIQEGEKAIGKDQFASAKAFFATALSIDSGKGGVAHDPYLTQRLVLATYKAKQPNHVEALNEAKKLLEVLGPHDSNDPETVGLAGAIEKRLFEEGQGHGHLKAAIWFYARGYYLRNDWYNAINFAYLLNVRADSELAAGDSERIADLVWANRIRREAIELCTRELAEISEREARLMGSTEKLGSELKARDREQKFWCFATTAEANVGLGDFVGYTRARADALAASRATWMVETMDGQIDKLKTLLTRRGHLLDPPWRAELFARVGEGMKG